MQIFTHLFTRQPAGYVLLIFIMLSAGCRDSNKPPENDVVRKAEQLDERTSENIVKLLSYAVENKEMINDSIQLYQHDLVNTVYENNNFNTVWSRKDAWEPIADSLYWMISHSANYGLFPEDYHISNLLSIRDKIKTDSVSRKNAALWARADILMTEAYFNLAKHLKLGRMNRDSITATSDSLFNDTYFLERFKDAVSKKNIVHSLEDLEPRYPAYYNIRTAIPGFLDSAKFVNYTYVPYPYKDSLAFIKTLKKRLSEEGYVKKDDTASMETIIKRYQASKGIKPSGKISEYLVRFVNNTDVEKFRSIAVTLDRYKMLPPEVPETYALVNLPSYTLYVYENDSVVIKSKVIVGASKTRTPQLSSEISNFITYPQWTVPYSIVFKEMLPKIQKDVDYLRRQNLMIVDRNDEVVNPYSIDWSKLSKTRFPYLVRQKEGDDNSLGVIKFNFRNKYSVYLHDTNARWLFSKADRALSHGCVRVQEWQKLSEFLLRNDTGRFPPDTLRAYFERQEKHVVSGFPKLPLFIRYFTVEGENGKLRFYSDIYGEDRVLKQKYFSNRRLPALSS
jgi:murein L,D-transpeptidase YcbB/YkuD